MIECGNPTKSAQPPMIGRAPGATSGTLNIPGLSSFNLTSPNGRRSARAPARHDRGGHHSAYLNEHHGCMRPRTVWRQMGRENLRPRAVWYGGYREMGLAGAVRGRAWTTTTQPEGTPIDRTTWSSGTSRRHDRISCGCRLLRTSRRGAASSTARLSPTSSRVGSSGGASPHPWRPIFCPAASKAPLVSDQTAKHVREPLHSFAATSNSN